MPKGRRVSAVVNVRSAGTTASRLELNRRELSMVSIRRLEPEDNSWGQVVRPETKAVGYVATNAALRRIL